VSNSVSILTSYVHFLPFINIQIIFVVMKFLLKWHSVDHSYIYRGVLFNKQLGRSGVSCEKTASFSNVFYWTSQYRYHYFCM